MEQLISIDYPKSLAFSLKMNTNEFQNEMKTVSLVKLDELGKISLGFASKLLNISRVNFIDMLSKYKVSYFNSGLDYDFENPQTDKISEIEKIITIL